MVLADDPNGASAQRRAVTAVAYGTGHSKIDPSLLGFPHNRGSPVGAGNESRQLPIIESFLHRRAGS